MAKPTLFWTVRERWSCFDPMRVTSIGRNAYHGTNEHGEPTHCRQADAHGRVETLDQAKALVAEIRRIDQQHRPLVMAAERNLSAARQAQRNAILEALTRERTAA